MLTRKQQTMDSLNVNSATVVLSFKWTDEYTKTFIRLRGDKKDYFTGKRNTARDGWDYVLKEMNLDGLVSVKQAKKKWDNLVHKYRELKNGRSETLESDIASRTWPFYGEMEEALGDSSLVTLPVVIASIVDERAMLLDKESMDEEGSLSSNNNVANLISHRTEGLNSLDMSEQQTSSMHTTVSDLLNQQQQQQQENVEVESSPPLPKKRKRDSDNAFLELFKQCREDWLRIHATFEQQGERMIALFGELVKSVNK